MTYYEGEVDDQTEGDNGIKEKTKEKENERLRNVYYRRREEMRNEYKEDLKRRRESRERGQKDEDDWLASVPT